MKKLGFVLMLCLVMIAFLVGVQVAEAQATYLIVCRGGGDMYFNYTPFSNFSPDPQIWISFERGPDAIGSGWSNLSSLGPGQCAWLDRPIASDEPDRIIVMTPLLRDFSISWQGGQVAGISSGLYYINALQNTDEYQSFRVYNDGNGNFIVTEIDQGTYVLEAPSAIAPLTGATFDIYPRTTTLQWAAVSNATSYTVQVDCLDCCRAGWWCGEFDTVWLEQANVTSTTFTFDYVGAQAGRWRVWALYSNGYVGPKSEWQVFTYLR